MKKAVSTIALVAALALGASLAMAQGAGGGGPANADRGGQGANSAMDAKNIGTPSSTGVPQQKK